MFLRVWRLEVPREPEPVDLLRAGLLQVVRAVWFPRLLQPWNQQAVHPNLALSTNQEVLPVHPLWIRAVLRPDSARACFDPAPAVLYLFLPGVSAIRKYHFLAVSRL